MSKTADLRKLLQSQLATISGATYHKRAPDTAVFPYKVFTMFRTNIGDLERDDIDLCIDIWDKSTDTKAVDSIADDIEDLLNAANLPQSTILPTIYRDSRFYVDDSDKDIQHVQMHFTVQNYKNI